MANGKGRPRAFLLSPGTITGDRRSAEGHITVAPDLLRQPSPCRVPWGPGLRRTRPARTANSCRSARGRSHHADARQTASLRRQPISRAQRYRAHGLPPYGRSPHCHAPRQARPHLRLFCRARLSHHPLDPSESSSFPYNTARRRDVPLGAGRCPIVTPVANQEGADPPRRHRAVAPSGFVDQGRNFGVAQQITPYRPSRDRNDAHALSLEAPRLRSRPRAKSPTEKRLSAPGAGTAVEGGGGGGGGEISSGGTGRTCSSTPILKLSKPNPSSAVAFEPGMLITKLTRSYCVVVSMNPKKRTEPSAARAGEGNGTGKLTVSPPAAVRTSDRMPPESPRSIP